MIKIFYEGTTIPAEDNGTPINPPSYWTPEILAGIAQAFADGQWEPVPEPTPLPPEPDWVGFNLAMIPPVGESDFEFWLDQFKILYQSSLATAAASGNAVETQRIYDLLKLQYPPTTEQIAAWQALADLHHVPLTF